MDLPKIVSDLCTFKGWDLIGDSVDVPLPGDRAQALTFEVFEHAGQEMLRASSPIGSVSELGTERAMGALRINQHLAFGALAVSGDQLVMVDTFLIADTDPGEISGSLIYLAENADRYEKELFGTDTH